MIISVIIPTYKPSKYIKDCLNSLHNQRLDSKQFEIIIVLNGCNSPYKEELMNFCKLYNNLNIKILQTNIKGVSHARNIGIETALGKYICFIDDDDIISTSYLCSLLREIDEHSIVMSNVLTFTSCIGEYNYDYLSKCYLKNRMNKKNTLYKSRSLMSTACCKLIPKYIISNIKFNTRISNGEDSLFMALISKNIKQIKYADKNAIYYRRIRINSASRKKIKFRYYVNNKLHLMFYYLTILIKNPFKYNFPFIATRIFASFLMLLKKR